MDNRKNNNNRKNINRQVARIVEGVDKSMILVQINLSNQKEQDKW